MRIFQFIFLCLVVVALGTVYEAENGVLSGGLTIKNSVQGFTGTGYVDTWENDSANLVITVDGGAGGPHDLKVRYRSEYDNKKTRFSLNGNGLGEYDLTKTSSFTTVSFGSITLKQGSNSFTIYKNWGYYQIDNIELIPKGPKPAYQMNVAAVDSKATQKTKNLLAYLQSIFGKYTLAGQDNIKASEQWMTNNIGKLPAMFGFDFIDYSPSRQTYQPQDPAVTESAIAWNNRGGIVHFQWHWNAPDNLTNSGDKLWWSGFYTDSCYWNLNTALNEGPGTKWYNLLLRDIDVIAAEIKKLSDADVPILWRPLHEAEGKWFWWGAQGPDAAIKLWKLVYDRLTVTHNLHNMIWVWNSVDPSWYPGDAYVDIVSFDSYPSDQNHGSQAGTFDSLVSLGSNRKLVAMMENGPIPDPDTFDDSDVDWLCFSTWSGDYLTAGSVNSLDLIKKVYNHNRILTLDELPDWKSFTATVENPTYASSDAQPSNAIAASASNTVIAGNSGCGMAVPSLLCVLIFLGLYF